MTAKDPWSARKNLYSTTVPKEVEKPKRRWNVLSILWLAVKRTCTVIGAFVLITTALIAWTFSSLLSEVEYDKGLPEKFVLMLNLDGNMGDLARDVSFADPFAGPGVTLRDWLEALDRAKTDPRVKGIYGRMDAGGYGLAHIEEMRKAIKDFRQSGKFAYVYSSSYGELGGLGNYYLALAFQEVWMQPMGVIAITGVSAELPFFRNIFDMVGVEPQFFQRKDYKSAYESLTHTQITEPNRRMMEYLIKDLTDTLQVDISADLGIRPESFKALVDKGLFTAPEALDAGLIDKADYADVLVKQMNKQVTGDPAVDADYIDLNAYINEERNKQATLADEIMAAAQTQEKKDDGKPSIALIYAVGMILPSQDGDAPDLFDDGVAAADQIAGALIEAARDEMIKAVVLRVDSPGGSPVASESILRAVQMVQEQGKQVIVSMGPTAASGGYWISAYANQIFVLPTTITGSIGVVGGKFSAKEFWAKIGVNWERIQWGQNAGMWSMNTPFSETEAQRMNAMLDNVYNNFLQRVASGRKMTVDEVDRIAGGRVWTGKSAVKIGLADRIGGLEDALDYAALQIGAKTRKDVHVVIMPKPLTAIEKFMQLLQQEVFFRSHLKTQAEILETAKPYLAEMQILSDPQSFSVYSPVEIKP
ncbi:MAG: signal peptide peptidase SppA [Alphaproteobacteria bacterium]|nr:signal peptide peptidase SppA [Alphaproteobacteria bacterium]MBP7758821.1 signal peptide peptidase SppA [Alphaproteobacteria bacterium]MBP7762105.1 signal peptide peptidase SppA [Alphaproteobacteria bacterium]MBP7904118.1 signal peptide peptidase SppA [Alphaproteobacteria bacterium]